ncbi:MAG: DUF4038 domain-containing protein [Chlorobia bacterium]|nr:DUF4038 domain-containing protein [Fimbriimonadaceae bacterium]
MSGLPRLGISEGRRHLVDEQGKPWYWLGDTAWEIFHRLTREEVDLYLMTRASQGFNVVQAVALAELDGLRTPNRYGDLPLLNEDPATPDITGDFWGHVNYVFDKAASLGIFIGLVPTWGDKVSSAWGSGPVVFNESNARQYGQFLSERYGDRENLIWINGGDREPLDKGNVWRALARGLRDSESFRHLMTFHPQGECTSSEDFHGEDWIDFNMMQTGHGSTPLQHITRMSNACYGRQPSMPFLDGEPRYENHPKEFNFHKGYFDDADVRQATYISLFCGGCGVTYGCHAIWQFASYLNPPINNPISDWQNSLHLPGVSQMKIQKDLMLSLPWLETHPNHAVLKDNSPYHALTTEDLGRCYVYNHDGGRVALTTREASQVKSVSAFDTRTGKWSNDVPQLDSRTWEPPKSNSRVNDWVMLFERG